MQGTKLGFTASVAKVGLGIWWQRHS